MALSQTVSKKVLARLQNQAGRNLKRMFNKWKMLCESENQLLNYNQQLKGRIGQLKEQLAAT
jgi:uncharacterized membrane protein YgaE (UPF0421/DUF939 family)